MVSARRKKGVTFLSGHIWNNLYLLVGWGDHSNNKEAPYNHSIMCSKSKLTFVNTITKDNVSFNVSQNNVMRRLGLQTQLICVIVGQKFCFVLWAHTRMYLNTNCVSFQEFMGSVLCWASFCKKHHCTLILCMHLLPVFMVMITKYHQYSPESKFFVLYGV
jgi:hypothetical protein